jgi:hypothetical protein
MSFRDSLFVALLAGCVFPLAAGRAAAAEARVVDAVAGTDVAGATVVVEGRVVAADAAGSFRVTETRGRLFARAPGYRAGTFDLAVPRQDGTLRIQPFTPKAPAPSAMPPSRSSAPKG